MTPVPPYPMPRLAVTSAVCLTLTTLLGCSALLAPSKEPVHFFVLTASGDDDTVADASGSGARLAIGLGPVTLPGYLDRREVVTRVAPNRLDLSQREQWAEPLGENVKSVLAQDLGARLGNATIAIFPWIGSFQPDYRIRIDFTRLEATSAGTVELAASWRVLAGNDVLVVRDSRVSRPIGEGGTEAAVAALSRALGELASDITAEVPRRRPAAAR